MLQSLAEWVPDAAIRRKILQDTPTKLFRTTTLITRPPPENWSESILANGHGPAIQESRASRN